jgi:hypothetical protein
MRNGGDGAGERLRMRRRDSLISVTECPRGRPPSPRLRRTTFAWLANRSSRYGLSHERRLVSRLGIEPRTRRLRVSPGRIRGCPPREFVPNVASAASAPSRNFRLCAPVRASLRVSTIVPHH